MSDYNFFDSARDDLQQMSGSLTHARDFGATAASQCRHAAECEVARQSAQQGDTTPRVCLCHPWHDARHQD